MDRQTAISIVSFKGIIEIRHRLQGRIRFKIPSLKKDDIKKLEQVLKALNGVKKAKGELLSKSFLVEFDENEIPAMAIQRALVRLLGLEDSLEERKQAVLTGEFKSVRAALNHAIHSKSAGILDLDSTITGALLLMLGYKAFSNTANIPGTITLLWWLYQHNSGEEDCN